MNIIKRMATNFKYYGVPRSSKLDSIEIHSIGTAQDEAEVIAAYMNQYTPGGIVHAICDAKVSGKVVELLPDNNLAWADAGYGNQHSFAIEIAESDQIVYTGGASYRIKNMDIFKADVMRGYDTAVEYTAKKCSEFGLNPLEKLPNGLYRVYSHREGHSAGISSNHGDPDHVWARFGLTMDEFRADVAAAMSPPEFTKGAKYKMSIGLALRKSPSGSAPFVMYRDIPLTKRHLFRKGAKGQAIIKKGVKAKCLGEKKVGKRGVYMQIARGWVLAKYRGKNRATKM